MDFARLSNFFENVVIAAEAEFSTAYIHEDCDILIKAAISNLYRDLFQLTQKMLADRIACQLIAVV